MTVIDGDMEHIHASGHARRDDLAMMYEARANRASRVPMHGEHRHLVEHAKWATTLGCRACAGRAERQRWFVWMATVRGPSSMSRPGRIFMSTARPRIGALDGVIRERLRSWRARGWSSRPSSWTRTASSWPTPTCAAFGAPKDGEGWTAPLDEMIADAIDYAIEDASAKSLRSDGGVEEVAARAIRRICGRLWGKKPVVSGDRDTRLEEE